MLPWGTDEKGSPLTLRKRHASAVINMRRLRKNVVLLLSLGGAFIVYTYLFTGGQQQLATLNGINNDYEIYRGPHVAERGKAGAGAQRLMKEEEKHVDRVVDLMDAQDDRDERWPNIHPRPPDEQGQGGSVPNAGDMKDETERVVEMGNEESRVGGTIEGIVGEMDPPNTGEEAQNEGLALDDVREEDDDGDSPFQNQGHEVQKDQAAGEVLLEDIMEEGEDVSVAPTWLPKLERGVKLHTTATGACEVTPPFQMACASNEVTVAALSSLNAASVCVKGVSVLRAEHSHQGFNLVVLTQEGKVEDARAFDASSSPQDDLLEYLAAIPEGRVLVAVNKGAMGRYDRDLVPAAFSNFGSWKIDGAVGNSTWALVGTKGQVIPSPYEALQPDDSVVSACLSSVGRMRQRAAVDLCAEQEGRNGFCAGLGLPHASMQQITAATYAKLAASVTNLPTALPPDPAQPSDLANQLPIIIVASNRSNYLLRHFKSLFRINGLRPDLVTVYTDGLWEDTANVCRVFGVRLSAHPKFNTTSARGPRFAAADQIALHYKYTLNRVWSLHPQAQFSIVLEEDLEVAPDLLSYFSQTVPLLTKDSALLTVSAWNDNAFEWSAADPATVYRTEFFGGLGWVLSRKLWFEDLMPRWPKCCAGWSWDLWLRGDKLGQSRHTITPDVSRTFHFGRKGANVNNDGYYMLYFHTHVVNKSPNVKLRALDRLDKATYDRDLGELFRRAVRARAVAPGTMVGELPNTEKCGFVVPDNTANFDVNNPMASVVSVWVYENTTAKSSEEQNRNFFNVVHCLSLWDLARVRQLYAGVLRLFWKGNHLLIASTESPYARQYRQPSDFVVNLPWDRPTRVYNSNDLRNAETFKNTPDDV